VIPVSGVLITRDEERHLPEALASLRFCDEVLVVDAGSTDRTREIAEAAGARVLLNAPWPGFVAQRRLATRSARHDWVLFLDADERVTPALRTEVETLREGGFEHAGYRIPRVAFYMGRAVRATDWYPDLQLRLFDRRRGDWQGALVHESVKVDGATGRLRGEIEHHPYADLADHLRRIDLYTSLWARQSFDAGRRTGALAPVAVAGWAFFRNYVLRRGFVLGEVGFSVSMLAAFYAYLKLMKLRELMRA